MPPSARRLERSTPSANTTSNAASPTLIKPFPFLELPDTVRQRFYELQLEAPRGFVRLYSKSGHMRSDAKVTPANIKINLMFTCRQIYQEAIPVLYRVNNFCIAPLQIGSIQSLFDKEMLQSDKWIHDMPVRGRNLIKKLELRLPFPPPDKNYDFELCHWQDMKVLFPGLKTLTLFFDANITHVRSWWLLPEPDACEKWFRCLKDKMPRAKQTFFDSRMLKPSSAEWYPLVETINKVWDVSTGESAHITQEFRHASKHAEQKKLVDKALSEEFGPQVAMHQGLSYWQIRQNQAANNFVFLTDDDTDDEVECFDKFDVEKIVAQKRRKVDALRQGSFDFEEEESSWW